MYKLYIKINNMYEGPKKFDDYETAKKHAKGEYLIIKRENNIDEVIEYGNERLKRKDDDWER